MAANWKFVFSRRGIKLIDYVEDCKTVDDVLSKFGAAGIKPPTVEEITEALGAHVTKVVKESPKPVVTQKKVAPKATKNKQKKKPQEKQDDRLVESPRKVDDLVVL